MSKLSGASPPQYQLLYQNKDKYIITVIQNEKSFREWDRRLENWIPRAEKWMRILPRYDLKSPKSLEFALQGVKLFEGYTQEFGDAISLLKERESHGHNELYTAMRNLSDIELEQLYTSSNSNATSYRQTELISNSNKRKGNHNNSKNKSSRIRKVFERNSEGIKSPRGSVGLRLLYIDGSLWVLFASL